MSLTLTTNANPGNAGWTSSSHVIVASGVATFPDGEDTQTATVPLGLAGAPILLSYQNDPNDYNISGGRIYGTISGTTLTIQLNNSTDGAGLKVSWAVLSEINPA